MVYIFDIPLIVFIKSKLLNACCFSTFFFFFLTVGSLNQTTSSLSFFLLWRAKRTRHKMTKCAMEDFIFYLFFFFSVHHLLGRVLKVFYGMKSNKKLHQNSAEERRGRFLRFLTPAFISLNRSTH